MSGTSYMVQYQYDDQEMSLGNFSRLDTLAYHDGTHIEQEYGGSGSLNDTISRLQQLSLPLASTPIVEYQYVGVSMVGNVDLADGNRRPKGTHPGAESGPTWVT